MKEKVEKEIKDIKNFNIFEKMQKVQELLKAPKSQFNKFGNYSYRNCEDILEALKPLLAEYRLYLFITDNIEMLDKRHYLSATVKVFNIDNPTEMIENKAYAREEDSKKGMDTSQVTGASSSYARKYALNGMFGIDDTKDSDITNTHGNIQNKTQSQHKAEPFSVDNAYKCFTTMTDEQKKKIYEHYNVNSELDMSEENWKDFYSKIIKKKG